MGFSPSGGGSGGSVSSSSDVAVTNPSTGQVLTWDGSLGKWKNQAGSTDPSLGGALAGTASSAQITAGVITDTHISSSAAIAQSKVANLTTDLADRTTTSAVTNAIETALASVPIIVEWDGSSWGTYDTSPTRVRFFMSQDDDSATAPMYYNVHDLWYPHPESV